MAISCAFAGPRADSSWAVVKQLSFEATLGSRVIELRALWC